MTSDYYLLYQPDVDWLSSGNAGILNEERARRISAASQGSGEEGTGIWAG